MTHLLKCIIAFFTGIAVFIILNVFFLVPNLKPVSANGCMGVPASPTRGDFRKYQQTCVNCTPARSVFICLGDGPNCDTNDYFFKSCGPREGFEELHK